jgi:hypothetical protein
MRLEEDFKKRMGELLAYHQILERPEELTDENYSEKVMAFQEKVDIMVDGNPRGETLWQLQFPWLQGVPRLALEECEADRVPGSQGTDRFRLRQDAAERYRALRAEVKAQGGVITVDKGLRPLTERRSVDRSVTSMHYLGLAFDLAADTGFFKPDTDTYVVNLGGNGYWEVWCRSSKAEEIKLNAVYWDDVNSGVDRTTVVQGKFINFTELCAQFGFYSIRPRMSFTRTRNRLYKGCEWWHFQANNLLIPNLSQFGIELLRIEGNSPESIRSNNEDLWCRKQAIFQADWF